MPWLFHTHHFVFLLCNLTYKQEGYDVDYNNIRHLKASPSVFFLKRFSGGRQIGLWLCWVTNCIFFSGNLCKVGSFVLTLILLFGICALYWPDHFYTSEFFKKDTYLKYGNSLRIKKKHGYYTSPCSVWKKSAWLDLCTSTGHFKKSDLCCKACQHLFITISSR